MTQFVLPKLGADMKEGRLVEWLKQVGEPVDHGEPIAVIETDKANVEVESFASGIVAATLVQPGDAWLPVGTPLAVIDETGHAAGPLDGVGPRSAQPTPPACVRPVAPSDIQAPAVAVPARIPADTATPGWQPGRVRISPYARRLAVAQSVAIETIEGSGPRGRIVARDVERAVAVSATRSAPATPAAATPPHERERRMREAVGAAMARSKREIPHYYLATTIDLQSATGWLEVHNRSLPPAARLLAGALFVKAVALALRDFPDLNGFWIDGAAQRGAGIHPGIAIALRGGGLIAPAIHHADALDLGQLMTQMQDLVQRARSGTLRSGELADATTTITSLGERGVDTVFGVINPPQLALVGFGKARVQPWVVDGRVEPRTLVTATLSADHRASDGHRGALFLQAIDRLLQQPETL